MDSTRARCVRAASCVRIVLGSMFCYKGQTRGPFKPIVNDAPIEFYIVTVEAGTTLNDAHLPNFRGGWVDPLKVDNDKAYRVAQTMSRHPSDRGGRGLGWEAQRYCKYVCGIMESGDRVAAMVLYEEAFVIEFPDFINTKELASAALSKIEEELELRRGVVCNAKNVASFAMRYRASPYIPKDPENPKEPRDFPSMRIGVEGPALFKKLTAFLETNSLPGPRGFMYNVTVHETRSVVDPSTRMMLEFDVKPCTWCVAVDPKPFGAMVALCEVQFYCTTLKAAQETAERPALPPDPHLRYTCIDAEAVFGNREEVLEVAASVNVDNPPFPKPDHPTSSSVMWSIVTMENPADGPRGILIELRTDVNASQEDGAEMMFKGVPFQMYFYDTEAQMLEGLMDWIRFVDPDVLVSYYGHGFDFPWAYRSNKDHSSRFYGAGRFIWNVQDEVYVRSMNKRVGMWAAAGIDGVSIMPAMSGRVMFDLLDYLLNLVEKFPSYKLDYFSQEWLGEGKAGFSRKIDIPLAWHGCLPRENYNSIVGADDALPEGVEPTAMQQLVALRGYCVYDSLLPVRVILARFDGQMRATSQLTCVQLDHVVNQKKIRLVVAKVTDVAWGINAMVNVLDADLPTDTYDGGHVFDPKVGYYGEGDPNLPVMNPQPKTKGKVSYEKVPDELLVWYELETTVITQDFQALYPSIIMAFGICIMRFLDDGTHLRRLYPSEKSTVDFCNKFGLPMHPSPTPKGGLPGMTDTEMRLHGPGVWHEAPNKEHYTSIIAYNPKKAHKPPVMYRFSKQWAGIFPPMLRTVLDSRFKKKALHKTFIKFKDMIASMVQPEDDSNPSAALGFVADMKELEKLGPKQWLAKQRDAVGDKRAFPHAAVLNRIERHIAVVDAGQLADKGIANSTYGVTAANKKTPVSCRPVASSICATGRQNLVTSHDKVLEKFKVEVKNIIYGDSVTGDTPVLVRRNKTFPKFVTISELSSKWGVWSTYTGEKEEMRPEMLEVWSDKGWTRVHRVIRHMTDKQMYLVHTPHGMVECTEDHSLLLANGAAVRPADIKPGDALLHANPPETYTDADVPCAFRAGQYLSKMRHMELEEQHMMFARLPALEAYVRGKYGDAKNMLNVVKSTKLGAAHVAFVAARLGLNPIVKMHGKGMFLVRALEEGEEAETTVAQTARLQQPQMVYDLETDNGHFAVGPGKLVVHNTDSIMLQVVGKTFKESFEFGKTVAKYLTHEVFGEWDDLVMEFESLEYKFLLVRKKGYATESWSAIDKPPKAKVKGLAVVRGGDFPRACTVMMQKLLDICDECGGLVIDAITLISVLELGRHLETMVDMTMPMEDYIISKSLGTVDKKDGSGTEHLRVAEKMEKRFGIPVVVKTKVDYVYILGEDGVDHPSCVAYAQLDRHRYLEQRIRKTISEIMILMKVPPNTVHAIFDMYSKALSEQMSPAVRAGYFKSSGTTADERLERCVYLLNNPPPVMVMRKRDAATVKSLNAAAANKNAAPPKKQASVADFFAAAKKKKTTDGSAAKDISS
jgi:DNA polymerase elongation subunit (family B)